jgi:DNA-binding NarL/FixJ family response regulator
MSGVEAVRQIVAARPTARILVLSLYQDDGSVEAALRAGARGYVVKDAPAEEVVTAVQAVSSGSAVIGGSLAGRLADLVHGQDADIEAREFPSLTSRERQILTLMAKGMTNSAIADVLGLSGKTVANYVSVVLAKVGVADRNEAAKRVTQLRSRNSVE